MFTKKNKVKKEKNNVDRDPLPLDPKCREPVNTLIRANANANFISNANIIDNEQSETTNWWINELASLGIKKSSSNEGNNNRNEPLNSQQLEDLTDDVKQKFIRDYKVCYNE
jgi:Asp-tRNA(Asn)/Glu-tRNA(Gln) amidotransferase B subunit